jgi:hypothetical protein
MVGRKKLYGSGSVDSAEPVSRDWTILATARRAGYNPLAYLTSYLDACAARAVDVRSGRLDACGKAVVPRRGGHHSPTVPACRRDI